MILIVSFEYFLPEIFGFKDMINFGEKFVKW